MPAAYLEEFRRRAVALVVDEVVPVAKRLGIANISWRWLETPPSPPPTRSRRTDPRMTPIEFKTSTDRHTAVAA